MAEEAAGASAGSGNKNNAKSHYVEFKYFIVGLIIDKNF